MEKVMAEQEDPGRNGPVTKRYYRKRTRLFNLINKIRLWPSRKGRLHGVRNIEVTGDRARLTTHCNKTFIISNSLNSRSGRWLRNKWFVEVCPGCGVPEWKLEKYATTRFRRHQGALLNQCRPDGRAADPAVRKRV